MAYTQYSTRERADERIDRVTIGYLIEFGGLPGSGKSTLARRLSDRTGAVLLRVDEIEAAMRRNGLTPDETGIAAYSVAHDIAAGHLRRGFTVIADAVNPVFEARQGWRGLAAESGAQHVVIEVVCPDSLEHRQRVEMRPNDVPGWTYPDWSEVEKRAAEYQPRDDDRLIVDSTRSIDVCDREIARYVGDRKGGL
jgi:predicted kinase